METNLPHIKLIEPSSIQNYTNPQSGGRGNVLPQRERQSHGSYIRACLNRAWEESDNEMVALHSERHGVYLEFYSSPGFEMTVKSLENLPKGIRLCNLREESNEHITLATVYIPNKERAFFFSKVSQYLEEESSRGKPKNAKLIESIDQLRKALLVESFWVDDRNLIPGNEAQWCEVWIRYDSQEDLASFEQLLTQRGIESKTCVVKFPERAVKLVYASRSQLEQITLNSDNIAEYRTAKHTADFFASMSPAEQAEWTEDLCERLHVVDNVNTSICILDTGVSHGHPLIKPILSEEDCHSVFSDWQIHDHNGHGTLMAGISAYDNLQTIMESTGPLLLTHKLESVKILPPHGDTSPELWGDITAQAISIPQIENPNINRTYCMAVTASDTRDKGRPSSWSGAVDTIISGAEAGEKQLLIISAGNITDERYISNYPDNQITDSVHDPGQAWNALTVGAYTQLNHITNPELSGYRPIANVNQLSPFSTTSFTWDKKWPIKPEVVFEGGNAAVDATGFSTQCEDLSLLSTYYRSHERLFEPFNMTSAATAQAAHFASIIKHHYPNYWPETIRALMVHSSEWPDELKRQFADDDSKTKLQNVLRACGYGVPDINRALYCASNSLTLVTEAELQPYEKNGSSYRTKDMHIYELPWPVEVLSGLGELEFKMRVTLSYYVEPGPGEIGWKDRYRYPSHILRFDINSPLESRDEFVRRINAAARDEDHGSPDTESASTHWVIGDYRNKGSIHSDTWIGTASELASSNYIAISPRIGWWRERHHLHKYNNLTRYSLIVSIIPPEQNINIDIYTPVINQVRIPVKVATRV